MNPELNHEDHNVTANTINSSDMREFLVEVYEATRDNESCELHSFTWSLLQVLDFEDSREATQDTSEFLAACWQEIRSAVSGDQKTPERLCALHNQIIESWGDQLTIPEDREFSDVVNHDEQWSDRAESDAQSDLEEPVAPSVEEITALLGSLGKRTVELEKHDLHLPQGASSPTPGTSCTEIQVNGDESTQLTIASLDAELRDAFLDDARGCVTSMEASLLRLESNPSDAEAMNQICRELHTLKGASASVGLSNLAEQLHVLEDDLRDGSGDGRLSCVERLLRTVDSIRAQISGNHERCETESQADGATNLQTDRLSDGPADDETVRVKSSQLNRLMDMLAELVMLRNRRETELSQLQEVYHELIGSVSKMRLLGNESASHDSDSSSLQLSEVANDVLEVAHNVRDCARPVAEGNAAVSQFIRQFRQELVELRRTPVSGLFRRLQRVVRDTAQSESKEVRLELIGENAGIERAIQQRLYEPLLHIVRNSVCHGIETVADRIRCGKDRVGSITLDAKSAADLFVVEIRDDGRGLDYDAIRRRGVDSGLLVADQAVSREELAQLIFHPGFSTREKTSQVAGRGVGMDVVASTLQRMRGWIEVDSEPAMGTRIRLSFPLPSVIQHAMVFRSAGQLFALPMQSVQSAGELKPDAMFLLFAELLGLPQVETAAEHQQIVLAATHDAQGGLPCVSLLVDEIVGPEEVVVRPLPPLVKHHPFCCGATLSGMGQTVLLLDARRIVESQRALLRQRDQIPDAQMPNPSHVTQVSRPRVLVVDDSLSARKRVVRSLQRYPFEIQEASDGKEALEILKTQCFCAVFSDMEMPHVSGMELLAEIQSRDHDDAPSVVIISSRSEDAFTNRAKQLGANSYLNKPLSDEALDRALALIPSLQNFTDEPIQSLETCGDIH